MKPKPTDSKFDRFWLVDTLTLLLAREKVDQSWSWNALSFEKPDPPLLHSPRASLPSCPRSSESWGWGGQRSRWNAETMTQWETPENLPNTAQEQTSKCHWRSIRPRLAALTNVLSLSNLFNRTNQTEFAFPFKLEDLISHFFPRIESRFAKASQDLTVLSVNWCIYLCVCGLT